MSGSDQIGVTDLVEVQFARSEAEELGLQVQNLEARLNETKGMSKCFCQVQDMVHQHLTGTDATDAMKEFDKVKRDTSINFVKTPSRIGTFAMRMAALSKTVKQDYRKNNSSKWSHKPYEASANMVEKAIEDLMQQQALFDEAEQALTNGLHYQVLDDLRNKYNFSGGNEAVENLEQLSEHEKQLRTALHDKLRTGQGLVIEAEQNLKTKTRHEEDAEHALEKARILLAEWEGHAKKMGDFDLQSTAQRQEQLVQVNLSLPEAQKKLAEELDESLRSILACYKSQHAQLLEDATAFEQKALHLRADDDICNHIVFLLDYSPSMRGAPINSLIAAVKTFLKARLDIGACDRISIITYNHSASIKVMNKEVSLSLIDVLEKPEILGGTAFFPAWQCLKQCVEAAPSHCRTLAVHVTDGFSTDADIRAASLIAANVHEEHPLTTIVVIVEEGVDEDKMEDLVKAGNGGRKVLEKGGECYQLLQSTASKDLVRSFKRIASVPLSERENLRSRAAQARATAAKLLTDMAQTESFHRQNHAMQVNAVTERMQALETNLKDEEKMLSDMRKQMDECGRKVKEAQQQMKEAEERYNRARQEKLQAKEMLEKNTMLKDATDEEAVKMVAQYREAMNATSAHKDEVLRKYKGGQAMNFDSVRSEEARAVIQSFAAKVAATHHLVAGMALVLGNFVSLGNHFLSKLKNPVEGLEDQIGSADVFRYLLESRGLQYDESRPANSGENLHILLVNEATVACKIKEAELDDVITPITSALTPEEFFIAAKQQDEESFKAALEDLSAKVKALVSDGLDIPPQLSTIQSVEKPKRLKELEKIRRDLEKKLKNAPEGETESLFEELKATEKEREDIEAVIRDDSLAKKMLQEVAKENRKTLNLLSLMARNFYNAYNEEGNRKTVSHMLDHLGGIVDEVEKSTAGLRKFADFEKIQREVEQRFASSSYHPGALASAGA